MRIERPEPSDRKPKATPPAGKRHELLDALREAQAARGWMPFATFMDLALFHPSAGYYARLEAVGATGDFATSPSLSPVFGTLFARQFHQVWRAMGSPSTFQVIELGPGGGQFAQAALAEASRHPRFMRALTYGLVERSQSLRARQAEALARWKGRTHWGIDLAEVAPAPVSGVIFSNEFFDALPCHRLEWTASGLMEVAVRVEGDRLSELLVPPTSTRLSAEITASGLELREGQRLEVSLSALDVMAEIAGRLGRGAVITVDYGDVASEVHSPRRLKGSVRGFFRHMAVDDPYARPGEQDLTYDVDFTALARSGARAGLATLGLLPQGEVLRHLGLDAEITRVRRGKSALAADQTSAVLEKLAHPHGMGAGFKVLVQGRGLTREELAGLGGAPLPRAGWRWWG